MGNGREDQMLLVFLLGALCRSAVAIRLHLNSRVMKCFSEDFPKQTQVNLFWNYEGFQDQMNFHGLVSVHSPRGEELLHEHGVVTGTRVVETTGAGYYRFCFASLNTEGEFMSPPGELAFAPLTFEVMHAGSILPKNVADKSDVEDASGLTKRVIADARELLARLEDYRDVEAGRRELGESTNTRVYIFALLNVVVLVALALWQSINLRQFLQKRKVI